MRCVTLGKILGTRVDKKCARLDKKSREGEKVRVWAKKVRDWHQPQGEDAYHSQFLLFHLDSLVGCPVSTES